MGGAGERISILVKSCPFFKVFGPPFFKKAEGFAPRPPQGSQGGERGEVTRGNFGV